MAKKDLDRAKALKNDEFYTRAEDIEAELRHYWRHFRGKNILCNCDDPRESEFFRYFANRFEATGINQLVASCYKSGQPDLFSRHDSERAVWQVFGGRRKADGTPDMRSAKVRKMRGDGDFRSDESVALLLDADIVVTNPPFSWFKEYIAQLIEYRKRFLVIGPIHALTYVEIFPLIRDGKIWVGNTPRVNKFVGPNGEEISSPGLWFTNLRVPRQRNALFSGLNYSPNRYPKYDNYDAVEVPEVKLIPDDYLGRMGVPKTFLLKHNPSQFRIIESVDPIFLRGKKMFSRIIIQRKEV